MTKLNHDKIKFFGETIYKFCGEFKIKKPFAVKPDKRLKNYVANVSKLKHKKTNKRIYIIRYSPLEISKMEYWLIAHLVLHELGHIKTKWYDDDFESEYKAEKFTHDIIKKHFKLQYKRYCSFIDWSVDNMEYEVYKKVFVKLSKNIER